MRLRQHARASSRLKGVSGLPLWHHAQASPHLKCVQTLWQDAQVCCRLQCVSDTRLWRGAQTVLVCTVVQICTCGECTSRFPSDEGFRHALVATGTISSYLKSVADLRLWQDALFLSEECFRHALVVIAQPGSRWNRARSSANLWAFRAPTLVPWTLFSAISSSVSRGTFTTTLVGHFQDQLEYVRKAAGARQHLSDDTDVDQCTGCRVQLLYAVSFQVGRLYARCWRCFNVWPFLGCARREAASRTGCGACVCDGSSQHILRRHSARWILATAPSCLPTVE